MVKKLMMLLLCLMLLVGCSKEVVYEEPELLTPVGVLMDTETVVRKDIYQLRTFLGTVTPEAEKLYFTQDGEIGKIYAVYGAEVKKGDVLATLNQKELKKEVKALEKEIETQKTLNDYTNQQLEKDLQEAQIAYNASVDYGADGTSLSLAWVDVEQAQLTLDQEKENQALALSILETRLERLKKQQGTGVIEAPYDGIITYLNPDCKAGSYELAYTPVFYIAKSEDLCIISEVVSDSLLERADKITTEILGQEYEIEVYPYTNEEYMTMVLSGGGVTSRFHFTEDVTAKVYFGDTAVITIISNTSTDTLVIPANALFRDEVGRYVFKIEDGKKVRCDVSTGLITTTEAEILGGLEEGDEVYVKE